MGVDIPDEVALKEYFQGLDAQREAILSKIKGLRPEVISKRETTLVKQRIADFKKGMREGSKSTKEQIKDVQGNLIDAIKASGLEAKDQAKFITTIKNIQTPDQFTERQDEIIDRFERLLQMEAKDKITKRIKTELKRTKPLKVGQKRVGKYDYESNKLFDELREYQKLNQDKAEELLESMSEDFSESGLIKQRFLSLKANGKGASLEIYNKVLEDISRMKQLGELAKDDETFLKMLDRQERIDNTLESIAKIKGSKDTIMGKITNAYRRGFADLYSFFNSIAGKDFADRYSPELNENKKVVSIYEKTKQIVTKTAQIYNIDNPLKVFEKYGNTKYNIVDFEGLKSKITHSQVMDIYNAVKNDKTRKDYYEAFGEGQIQSLLGNLTVQDREAADYWMDTVQGYRDVLNLRNIEITGRDLGFIENYWSGTSEHQESVLDDIKRQGEIPSAMKERAKTKVIPVPTDAWMKTQKHIVQAEHIKNLSREYETLKRIFTNRKVKHALTDKFGDQVYKDLMKQLDNISLNKQVERLDAISGVFKKAVNNWVTAKIALNPSTFVRQLVSVGNYAEVMPAKDWVSGFAKGMLSPKETFDFMWKNAPFLEARFNRGYSEALVDAIAGAKDMNRHWGQWTSFLTSFARIGDVTAIVYGGYPLVKAELAKGRSMKEAMKVFEQATLRAQQSSLSSSLSRFQNSKNPFARIFLAFKNTSTQYLRKMSDAVISYNNGDISADQAAKTLTIYGVIQPILFASAGFGVREGVKLIGKTIRGESENWDDFAERITQDILIQLAVNPFNAIPVVDDIVESAAKKAVGKKVYKIFTTPLFDELETSIRKLYKEDITGEDWLEAIATILEPVSAAPVKTALRYINYYKGDKDKVSGMPKIGG